MFAWIFIFAALAYFAGLMWMLSRDFSTEWADCWEDEDDG